MARPLNSRRILRNGAVFFGTVCRSEGWREGEGREGEGRRGREEAEEGAKGEGEEGLRGVFLGPWGLRA